MLPLKVQECPDFSILQTIYPYVARMAGLSLDFLFHRRGRGTDIEWNDPRRCVRVVPVFF